MFWVRGLWPWGYGSHLSIIIIIIEELGRHRGREGRKEWQLCNDECESVRHVFLDCPVYSTLRNDFICKLQELLGDILEYFESLDSFEKVLGSEVG